MARSPLARTGLFDIVNYACLTIVAFVTLYPFWNIMIVSFATPAAYYAGRYNIIPRSFTLDAYIYNFSNPQVFLSFLTSITVTVLGTTLSLLITSMTAWVLSKRRLAGRNVLFFLFVLTMFINGGLIPFYVLISKLGMRNTLFVLFIPQTINMFFLILTKNYFVTMPVSLEESAKLDGANDFVILFRIILPIAKPIVATISLFYAAQFWNDWFTPMIFLSRIDLYPLSLYLKNLLGEATSAIDQGVITVSTPATVRASVIMITITPIILVYPFLQKHFVKGVLLGAVKE